MPGNSGPTAPGPLSGRPTGFGPGVTCRLFGLFPNLGHDLVDPAFRFFIDPTRGVLRPFDRFRHFRSVFFLYCIENLRGFLFDLSKLTLCDKVGFGGHAIGFVFEVSQGRCRFDLCQQINLEFRVDIGIENRLGECIKFIDSGLVDQRSHDLRRGSSAQHRRQSAGKRLDVSS
jgi:hypothetical protein